MLVDAGSEAQLRDAVRSCVLGEVIDEQLAILAAAMMQPSGFRPEIPDLFYQNNIKGWGPALCEKRPDITMDMVHDFLTSMYTNRADFVFTVSRDFVDRKSTRLNSSHIQKSRMPSSA